MAVIHLFYGEDEFSLHEEFAALKAQLDSDGMLVSNTSQLDGGRLQPAELLAPCSTIPFLGSHRLGILRGGEGALRAPARAGKAPRGQELPREHHPLESPPGGSAGPARYHHPRLRGWKDE